MNKEAFAREYAALCRRHAVTLSSFVRTVIDEHLRELADFLQVSQDCVAQPSSDRRYLISVRHEPYGDKAVDSVLAMQPHERIYHGDAPPTLDNQIAGILVGYDLVRKARGGHVDVITLSYAEAEIKALIDAVRLAG